MGQQAQWRAARLGCCRVRQRLQVSDASINRVEALAKQKLQEFRAVLRRQPSTARLVLRQMIRERLVLTPGTRGTQRGYRFSGEGSLMPLLAGMIPELSQGLASPTGLGRLWTIEREGLIAA